MSILKECDDSVYPSKLYDIAKLDIRSKDIIKVVSFYRYLGLNICEAISFLYIEMILRIWNSEKIIRIINSPWDILFSYKQKLPGTSKIEKEKMIFKDSYIKLLNILQKYINTMSKNENQSCYEIVYDFYLACKNNEQLKIASKLLLKNEAFKICKKRGLSDGEIKKLTVLELNKDLLYEKDYNFLAESLGIHIQVCHIDTKGDIMFINYKDKKSVEKPYLIKILQKNGKFYGLCTQSQNINIDNAIFDCKKELDPLNDGKPLTLIPRKSKNSEILDIKNEETPKVEKSKIEEKKNVEEIKINNKIYCCICYNEITTCNYFNNPSCNHIYCYPCIVDRCDKKQFFNLCFERICTKSLSIGKLEKFLLEMSMNQTSQNEYEGNQDLIEYEQECYICHKLDKIYLESFMQYEYYKCFFCQKISCIVHKASMEKCFCVCLKCFEQTRTHQCNTQKRCFKCKDIYCTICAKTLEKCKCYCKVCGESEMVEDEYCIKCRENCNLCNIFYHKKDVIICVEGKKHYFCRFCAFKDKNFFQKKSCIICIKNKNNF